MKPAILAAHKIAIKYGLTPDRCEVLQDGHTIVIRLTETLVARVVTDLDGPRKGKEWFERETAVAAHLSACRAPVIPMHPSIPQIAHECEGFTMNFWQYVHSTNHIPEPLEIGSTLQVCHELLRGFPEVLPSLAILHESLAILNATGSRDSFSAITLKLLKSHLSKSLDILSALPHQALHGDAHMGNIMMTKEGLLWTDWEDAFCGPIEWDVASIIWNAKLLDHDEDTANSILASYESKGSALDKDGLWQSLIARAAVMSAWYPILYPNPSPDRIRKLKQRIEWLESV